MWPSPLTPVHWEEESKQEAFCKKLRDGTNKRRSLLHGAENLRYLIFLSLDFRIIITDSLRNAGRRESRASHHRSWANQLAALVEKNDQEPIRKQEAWICHATPLLGVSGAKWGPFDTCPHFILGSARVQGLRLWRGHIPLIANNSAYDTPPNSRHKSYYWAIQALQWFSIVSDVPCLFHFLSLVTKPDY